MWGASRRPTSTSRCLLGRPGGQRVRTWFCRIKASSRINEHFRQWSCIENTRAARACAGGCSRHNSSSISMCMTYFLAVVYSSRIRIYAHVYMRVYTYVYTRVYIYIHTRIGTCRSFDKTSAGDLGFATTSRQNFASRGKGVL